MTAHVFARYAEAMVLTGKVNEMNEIIVLSSSTGYMVMGPGHSYIEKLGVDFNLKGVWVNGYTIIHALRDVGLFLRGGQGRTVILHVGAVECFSHKASYFLHDTLHNMVFNNLHADPRFVTFVLPRMLRAASDSNMYGEALQYYYRWLDMEELKTLWHQMLTVLAGTRVIVIGMTHPLIPPAPVHTLQQAEDSNEVMRHVCSQYPHAIFIDIFGLTQTPGFVGDSNHLTQLGHESVYNIIRSLLEA
jgi:hypothetical protein